MKKETPEQMLESDENFVIHPSLQGNIEQVLFPEIFFREKIMDLDHPGPGPAF